MSDEATPAKRGPKTEEGKKRSSLNALRHGLYAKREESGEIAALEPDLTYDEALDLVRTCYQPVDQIEDAVVKRLALCMHRLSRYEAMERFYYGKWPLRKRPGETIEAILKAERVVSMEFHRCLRTLAAKRAAEFRTVKKMAAADPLAQDEILHRYPWIGRLQGFDAPGPFGAPNPTSIGHDQSRQTQPAPTANSQPPTANPEDPSPTANRQPPTDCEFRSNLNTHFGII